jgi:hypothetical protein
VIALSDDFVLQNTCKTIHLTCSLLQFQFSLLVKNKAQPDEPFSAQASDFSFLPLPS